ncbi:MAG: glycosyltransferase, partial [Bacteroidota bacterium]|nr:glycosyltransferase [Bacteroidota bacterium]
MGKNKKIWIVVPVFSRPVEIHNLLNDLLRQTYYNFHVVVVDHGTEKVDFSLVTDSRVEILSQSSKFWWTGAINRGLEHVLREKKDGEFILIINDDVVLDGDYLENVVAAGNKYPDAIIGSISVNKYTGIILSADNRLIFSRAKFGSSWQGKKINEIKEKFVKSDILPGRGMLIPESVI